jgi:hypothetical protein
VIDGNGLTFDGTLQLWLVGGFQPFPGQTFQLFPAATPADLGAFDSIIFDQPGYAGSFNYTNGTLTIVAVPEPSPARSSESP